MLDLETTGEIRWRLAPRVFSPRRLRELRIAAGLRQREMADAIARETRHYQKIEAGEVNPTAVQLGQIAHALRVTIDSLYAMPDKGESVP